MHHLTKVYGCVSNLIYKHLRLVINIPFRRHATLSEDNSEPQSDDALVATLYFPDFHKTPKMKMLDTPEHLATIKSYTGNFLLNRNSSLWSSDNNSPDHSDHQSIWRPLSLHTQAISGWIGTQACGLQTTIQTLTTRAMLLEQKLDFRLNF
ncbi:hypothetical protein AVEN_22915-1 [Araneus ventricosus]|uniref:Uncharacterized protein n=1 Tax=Araneus ventricosus TaxID=182803 RepID=A0A4Y2D4Z5_ARAVE|nr:hypothetical protein AVEN_22915-1 [Araneus ventricosus]